MLSAQYACNLRCYSDLLMGMVKASSCVMLCAYLFLKSILSAQPHPQPEDQLKSILWNTVNVQHLCCSPRTDRDPDS